MSNAKEADVSKKRLDFFAEMGYFVMRKVGFRFEYRIVAVNKASEGEASNTVMLMLQERHRNLARNSDACYTSRKPKSRILCGSI